VIGNKIKIDFPKEGKIGIFGYNEVGKTTLFDAIEFALFGLALRGIAKEDRITWGKNKLSVILEFSSGDKQYRIDRYITSRGIHKAKFVQLNNGQPITSTEVNSITTIEEKIEEILGIDKNSYSKLIYIRQKELDALKELQKQDREKLINKVMGIDLFDDASKLANSDLKEEKENLKFINTKLDILKIHYETYLKKSKEIEELDSIIDKLKSNVNELQNRETELKKELKQLEWIKDHNSQKDIIDSKKSDLESQTNQLNRFESEKSSIKKYEQIIEKLSPQLSNLSQIHDELKKNEEEILKEKEKINEEKIKIPDSFEDQSKLKKKRSTNLKTGIGLLSSGIILIALGFVLIYLLIPGIILFVMSFVYMKRYGNLDKQMISSIDNQAIIQSINSREQQILKNNQRIAEIQNNYGSGSSNEVMDEINKLNSEIYDQTSFVTIDDLRGALHNIKNENNEEYEGILKTSVKSLKRQIAKLETDLKKMEEQKPPGISLESSLGEYKKTKEEYENILHKLNTTSNDLSSNIATKEQLEEYCNDLQKDYEEYPNELEKKEKSETKNQLLDFVIQQFKLVSLKLRGRVIPQARSEINFMLPTITDNRYSDFDITEDLKFKVYTSQVGGYKERELFSGGDSRSILNCFTISLHKKHS